MGGRMQSTSSGRLKPVSVRGSNPRWGGHSAVRHVLHEGVHACLVACSRVLRHSGTPNARRRFPVRPKMGCGRSAVPGKVALCCCGRPRAWGAPVRTLEGRTGVTHAFLYGLVASPLPRVAQDGRLGGRRRAEGAHCCCGCQDGARGLGAPSVFLQLSGRACW